MKHIRQVETPIRYMAAVCRTFVKCVCVFALCVTYIGTSRPAEWISSVTLESSAMRIDKLYIQRKTAHCRHSSLADSRSDAQQLERRGAVALLDIRSSVHLCACPIAILSASDCRMCVRYMNENLQLVR